MKNLKLLNSFFSQSRQGNTEKNYVEHMCNKVVFFGSPLV